MSTSTAAADPKIRRAEEVAYFKEASSWDDDRVLSLRKSRRSGWWVAGAEFFLILLLTLAILIMLPLKTTDVRLVRVELHPPASSTRWSSSLMRKRSTTRR